MSTISSVRQPLPLATPVKAAKPASQATSAPAQAKSTQPKPLASRERETFSGVMALATGALTKLAFGGSWLESAALAVTGYALAWTFWLKDHPEN